MKIRLPPQLLHILHFDYSPWLLLLLLLHLRPKSLTSLMVLALSFLLSRSSSRRRSSSCSSSSRRGRRRKREKEQQLGRNSLDIVAVSQKQLFAVCLTDTYPTVPSPYHSPQSFNPSLLSSPPTALFVILLTWLIRRAAAILFAFCCILHAVTVLRFA